MGGVVSQVMETTTNPLLLDYSLPDDATNLQMISNLLIDTPNDKGPLNQELPSEYNFGPNTIQREKCF